MNHDPVRTTTHRKPAAERLLEASLFHSRWLMAPMYFGLVLALAGLVWVFAAEAWRELSHLPTMSPEEAILMALSLIDLSLAGNLLLIVIFSGYENSSPRSTPATTRTGPSGWAKWTSPA
jgi:uncharacterized protein (TIGR00645 family)